jgi:hypothetical protein
MPFTLPPAAYVCPNCDQQVIADSLAVEDARFSFFDIQTALIPNSRVAQ